MWPLGRIYSLMTLKEKNLSQNMHKDHFRLIVFKKQQTGEELWKPSQSYPLVREIYIYKGNLPLSTRKRVLCVCVCVCVCVCCHVQVFVTL